MSPKKSVFTPTCYFVVYILWVHLHNSYALLHWLPFSVLCFILSLFWLSVYKPMRITMPVCVLSGAYCCRYVSVPLVTSTRCKVETIAADRVPCICTGLTSCPFLLPLTPSLVLLPWPLTSAANTGQPVMSRQGRFCSRPFDRTV